MSERFSPSPPEAVQVAFPPAVEVMFAEHRTAEVPAETVALADITPPIDSVSLDEQVSDGTPKLFKQYDDLVSPVAPTVEAQATATEVQVPSGKRKLFESSPIDPAVEVAAPVVTEQAEVPQPIHPEASETGHEQLEANPALARKQIRVLDEYVRAADRTPVLRLSDTFQAATKKMQRVTESVDGDEQMAQTAILAVAAGALAKDPQIFRANQSWFFDTLTQKRGMPREQARVFMEHQTRIVSAPDERVAGEMAKRALRRLDQRAEREGEDVTAAKLAVLTGTLAATKHPGLRKALFRDIEKLQTKPA